MRRLMLPGVFLSGLYISRSSHNYGISPMDVEGDEDDDDGFIDDRNEE